MILKSIKDINNEDFQNLVDNGVTEGKTIEYKQDLILVSDSDKKEFLYDVSSFANASGGDLIIGIVEDRDSGLPNKVEGIDVPNTDDLIRKIESLIRDSVAPRVIGIQIKLYLLLNTKYILLIRIPKSWNSPHQVIFKGAEKFYSRATNGKYKLDVSELRNAFLLTDTITERVRKFREERLSKIIADETPVGLLNNAKIVLQFIPLTSFEPSKTYDITSNNISTTKIAPLRGRSSGWTPQFNLDGILCSSSPNSNGKRSSYIQLFRNGIIETVNSDILEPDNQKLLIPSVEGLDYEYRIIESVQSCTDLINALRIEIPVYLFVTFVGVKGYFMQSSLVRSIYNEMPIDRDILLLPEVVLDITESTSIPKQLKPIFDMVWNACGYERSFNFDEAGNWKRLR